MEAFGEAAIATSAEHSYLYAKEILRTPFLLGEAAIAKNAHYNNNYKKLFPKKPKPAFFKY